MSRINTGSLAGPYLFAGLIFIAIGLFGDALGVTDGAGGVGFIIIGLVVFFCSNFEATRR